MRIANKEAYKMLVEGKTKSEAKEILKQLHIAIKNYIKNGGAVYEEELFDISRVFPWSESPQGYSYWLSLRLPN